MKKNSETCVQSDFRRSLDSSKILISDKGDQHEGLETRFLYSIPGMRESIIDGMEEDIKKCSDSIDL